MSTIYESFREAVDPHHVGFDRKDSGGGDANANVSAPSDTTRAYEPPNFLLRTSESKWLSIADAALNQHRERLDQKHIRLASWESNMRMDSEGDVVYGSAIYLNNPVHIALHAAQDYSPACAIRSEVTQGTTSRADKGYFCNGRAYAILGYKKVGAVSRSCARGEFEYGVPKDARTFAAWMSRAERRFADNQRGVENTRFLLQQSVHYHDRFGARFVAMFDWNVLVLLAHPQCRGVGLNDKVSYAYITEVTDNRKFRRALLGFLLFAYRNSLSVTPSDLQKIRPGCLQTYAEEYHRRLAEETKYNKSKNHNYQGPRNRHIAFLAIDPQESFSGSKHIYERGRTGDQHPYTTGNKYNNTDISSVKNQRRTKTPDPYQRRAAVTDLGARSRSEDASRFRKKQASNHSNPENRSRVREPAPMYQVNLAPSTTHATSNSTHPHAAKTAIIHTGTYVPTRSRDETKSPSRNIGKQPSSGFATKQGGSGGVAINKQNSAVNLQAARPHLVTTSSGQAGPDSLSEPSHVGSHKENSYHAHQGPSTHQTLTANSTGKDLRDILAGSHKKEKGGRKFLGIFKLR